MAQIGSIHEDCVNYDFQPLTQAEQEAYTAQFKDSQVLNEKEEPTKSDIKK